MKRTYIISRLGLHSNVTDEVKFTNLEESLTTLNNLLGSTKYKVLSFTYMDSEEEKPTRQYSVYIGKKDGKVVYVGTTIQKPEDRWRWHKANGKDLDFELLATCEDEQEMLDMEYQLIQKYHPSLNKITKRKQNFNVKLTQEVLYSRKGDASWCQCCLKRHVRPGYRFCYYCGGM